MRLKPPEHNSQPGLIRFYEAASVCCLLASLALLLSAGEASLWVLRLTSLGADVVNAGLFAVAVCWALATIFCARRSLALRHGASHFEQGDFEAEIEWTERFLGLRESN